MKFKCCFTLMAILVILLSLACVAASENITEEMSLQEDDLHSLESIEVSDELSASEGVDLSVDLDVEPSYVDGKYNPVGSEVPWTITVSAKGGVAYNTQVRSVLSSNLGYVSHNLTMGEYDPSTGIWKVGNLTGSSKASLIILTKLNSKGTYLTKVYALTDSQDTELLNNFKLLSIKTDSSKITSNITETTDDRIKPVHNYHYGSMIKDRIKYNKKSSGKKSSDKDHSESTENSNSIHKSNSKNILRSDSLANVGYFIQSIFDSNSSSNSTSNSTSDSTPNLENNSMNRFVDVIPIHDYFKIPLLIFSAFLVILFAILIYDKRKN